MNAMHTSVFSLFLASHPGMLQTLPLKINFVPKFGLSYVVGWTCCCYHPCCNSSSNWLDIGDISLFRMSLESSLSNSEQSLLERVQCCLPTFLGNPIVFVTLFFLSFTSYFGEVSILGNQLSMYGLVMVYKIRFHGSQDNTQEVR
jgi:hypothetical protein